MEILILIVVLIFSVIIHEYFHGAVAYSLGDDTAKNMGRLTLNPIPHLDIIGSIILPFLLIFISILTGGGGIIFGWAKPVPINPNNFRDRKYGELKVALAGPLANFSLALIFGLLLRFLPHFIYMPGIYYVFSYIVYLNLLLCVFNLFPVPPLDGSHVLFFFFPHLEEKATIFFSQFGLLIIFFVIFFLSPYLTIIIDFIFKLIVGKSIVSF